MGKYYLFSDFSKENGFSLIADEFKRDLKDYNKMVFIASDPSIGEITDKYAEKYLKWFEKIGINFENKVTLDNFNDELKELSYKYLIYGMCDESAIIVRNDKCTYYGDIYVLKNGTAEKVISI